MSDNIKVKIFRYDPSVDKKPYYKTYTLDFQKELTVLDCLNEIKANHDSTLTYRRSCRHAICGSCAMKINNVNRLACHTHIKELKTNSITVEPLQAYPHIKDLVVDLTDFYEKLEIVKPWLESNKPFDDKENLQTKEQRSLVEQAALCILCGACTSSCPTYWTNNDYLGPAALYKAYRFCFDSRDKIQRERMHILNNQHALFRCHNIFNCVESCPKGLNPTSGISKLKSYIINNSL